MKTIDEYMALPYRLEIVPDPDEGGYVAAYPDLKGCLSAGNTIEEAVANAMDAKREWLTAAMEDCQRMLNHKLRHTGAMEDGYPIPEPIGEEEYSGQFKLRIPKSLHRQLALQSKKEGISMNQYCLYLLSQNNALRL